MYIHIFISQYWLIPGPALFLLFAISIMALLSCIHPRSLAAYPKSSAPQTVFYVAPDGKDHNPGTEALPFATLERARDAIREMKHRSALPKNGVTVWLRGGDYIRAKTLELTSEDSGTPEATIVWCAYPGERVRILGGHVITGFQPVTDESVQERLDETARGKVLVTDLQSQGIHDYGMLRSRGFSRPTTPAHGELFFGGLPMTLARWPNPGDWERIRDFPKENGSDDGHGTIIGALNAGFFFDSDRPTRWKSINNIWIHGYWAYDWANSYERISELDVSRRFIRTAEPHGNYGFKENQRIYFLNILEELDEPGEWFLDNQTGKLYFWPPAPIDTGEALFSLLEQPLVKLVGASHITFRGITFEATRGNAIEINNGERNLIAGCHLGNIGNWAVTISGGKNHGVQSCDIFDTGDGGVTMSGGDRQTLMPGNHFVDNCHFQRQGRWSKCYVPAISMNGVGLRASHNLIHDHPHAAFLFGGNDNLIEFNEIHHVALETGDVGAIYTGRDYTIRGNRIRYNYLHHTSGPTKDARGVYMDDCVSGTEVFGNVFYKAHWAMFIGGGRDHHVENNLFVDCDPAVVADGRGLETRPIWRNMVDKTMREGLKSVPLNLYRERYPEMKALDAYYGPPEGPPIVEDAFTGIPPEGNIIARNVCLGDWLMMFWLADEKLFDIRDNFVTKDRTQVGGPETGFRLPSSSPAWEKGFKPIPFGNIGLYSDSYREHQPILPRLKVSENGRFLVTEDNRPFFWLGDTAWWIRRIAPDDVDLYMSSRAGHGFNVIQVHPGYNAANYAGEYPFINNDTDTPNEAFWSEMDMVVAKAYEHKLYIALVPMWGSEYGKAFGSDSAKAQQFGRWLGDRYVDKSHVLWIVSGEYDAINGFRLPINETQKAVLNAMAHGLRDAHKGKQLMTIHPGVARTSSIDFHQEDWLDFNMLQSGHIIDCSAYKMPDTDFLISRDYALTPTKPVLDGEPMYEDTPDAVWTVRHVNGIRAEADTMRRKAYWAVFSGACGHTYGHNDVYGFFEPAFPGQILTLQTNPSGPGQRGSWRIALDAPGASQMKHLRSLMESRPFYNCVPYPGLIIGDAGKGLEHTVAMRASDGSYGMVYLPTGKPVIVALDKLTGKKFNAWWYDPRNGSFELAGSFDRIPEQEFRPPASKNGKDWILVLDDVARNYKIPDTTVE